MIHFQADELTVTGPKSTDKSYVIKMGLGEYMKQEAAQVLQLDVESGVHVFILDDLEVINYINNIKKEIDKEI